MNKYPCSHAYLHYIDSDGNSRCDECDRVAASVECVCGQRPARIRTQVDPLPRSFEPRACPPEP